MKPVYKIIPLLCLLLLLPSCITNRQKLYLQHDKKDRYEPIPFEQYRLVVNDEVSFYLMTSHQETQSLYNGSSGVSANTSGSRLYRIYEDGCVVLPTVGRLYIAGSTIREAEVIITEEFKEIVPDAEVKLALANNYFYVLGDNGKGQFQVYKENMNIFQALALAGDISSSGDKSRVKLIRRGDDGIDHIRTFDLRKESIIESEFYYIQPNDQIYIPTSSKSFFRVESFSGFVAVIATPLSLLALALTYIKK
ncbi:polysaccharide biosynthesis/export family protein [Bacteroidales bacterium OttesenSCG-928-A17]|nr:polysaccharide biosynthesis/export family protein [Bacteroidales bacterium OttesenSCG-928-A17]